MGFDISGRPEYANKLRWDIGKDRGFSDSVSISFTLLTPHPRTIETEAEVFKFAAIELQKLHVEWLKPDGEDDWIVDFDRVAGCA